MTGYVQLERLESDWLLAAAVPERAPRAWTLGADDLPTGERAARELADSLAEADVVLCSADELVEWLSAASVLRQTRNVLARLVDVGEALLLIAPELADSSLGSFCAAHAIRAPSPADPETFLPRWEMVGRRLRERARAMPPEARSLVAAVAGPAWPEALLGPIEPVGSVRKAIAAVLPRRPRRARIAPVELAQGLQDTATSSLTPGGPVAAAHPAYEHRHGQIEMARAVAAAFEREEFLLVEAGTGTGKSLAYLLPAIAFARTSGAPVILSTNTKNLQDQLVQRDIPLAGKALGIEFRAELLKGRSNYVCPRLLSAAVERAEESVFRDDRLALAHLIAWAARAPIADLDTLAPGAFRVARALRDMVRLVRARNDACSGRRCAYYQSCPVEVARARAQSADVVVVNHALLLASAGTAALPEHRHVVIDEAHNLEDVATDQLGREVTDGSLRTLLRALAGEEGGALHERTLAWLASGDAPDQETIAQSCTLYPEVLTQLEYALEDLGAAVLTFIDRTPSLDRGSSERTSVRLTSEVRATRPWQAVVEALPPVAKAIETIRAVLTVLHHAVTSSGQELDDTTAALALDIEQLATLLTDLETSLAIVIQGEADQDFVCWVASWVTRRADLGWGLRAAPIDVGPALKSALYDDLSTAIMTSATLTVQDSFDYLRQRLGLDGERDRLLELVVPSPFDFPNQLLMCIPADLPLANDPKFEEASQEAILQAALAAGGGTLCLFTSRESMTRAFEQLRARLEAASLTPICQDLAASRTAALEALRDDPTAVLFGVKSFWEGVDVPGQALRCLVIVKLPFAVPSDPIIQARQERVEERGLNGYDEFYVPNAVIGFRQGIGRLIRTKADRGVVFVLDRRILLRRYGERFLQSMPSCRVERGPLRKCIAQAREMLGGGERPLVESA
jgi:Rad3-related DNA helicase